MPPPNTIRPPELEDLAKQLADLVVERVLAALPAQGVGACAPLVTTEPWRLFNMSHTTWNRLKDKPLPVDLTGTRKQWRIADLQAFAARLKPIRRRKARSTFGPLPAAAADAGLPEATNAHAGE